MKGTVASEGYAAGKAYIFRDEEIIICNDTIDESQAEEQITRFTEGLEKTRIQIEEIGEKAGSVLSGTDADVFRAHVAITQDRSLIRKVSKAITQEHMTADNAVYTVMGQMIEKFSKMENPLIRERAADLKDVCDRLLRVLNGVKSKSLGSLPAGTVIVAENLTPSDTVTMDIDNVAGIVSETGGSTSHTAIFARSLGIPAVVGVAGAASAIQDGEPVYLDGEKGIVETGLSGDALEAFEASRKAYDMKMQELFKYANAPSVTKDGRHVEICANIGSFNDCSAAQKFGIEGIGLFRTEFLYMGSSSWPSEDYQFAEYKRVLELMDGRPVIIRTLDIGGDKGLPYYDFEEEDNPFLGYRAIRLCLDRKDIFKTQLRAILRAGLFGKARIMYPMISSVGELKAANEVLEEARAELRNEGIPFEENVEHGIMIETPAACVIADKLINVATFIREQYSAFMDNVELIPLGVVTPEIMEYINSIHEARKIIACIGSYPMELGDVPFIKISDMLQESGQSELNWILHQEREKNIRNTRLSSFVYSDAIFTDIDIVNKEDAILFMSEQLSAEGYVKESYIKAAIDREREVSTDYRNGTALPHAGSEHVNRSVIGIMRLKEPIFWNGDVKVRLVFLIALEKTDIKLVTILSRLIKDEESMRQLLTGSEDDILEAFNRFDEKRNGG